MRSYTQVESARAVDATLPASPISIDGDDLLVLQDAPAIQEVKYDNLNFRAQWAVPVEVNGVEVGFTPPREFGLNLRYAFGSR